MTSPARALVLCPGRGSYSRATLGSLSGVRSPGLDAFDAYRAASGHPTVRELDAAPRFSPRQHLVGEHASSLTAGCSIADIEQLDPEKVTVVALCGNSMGWYTALAAGGALSLHDGARLIETMGWYQAGNIIGGQIVYPIHNDDWQLDPDRCADVERAVAAIPDLHWSIRLGGQAVLAGTDDALAEAIRLLPPIEGRYTFPLRLPKHSAFHTPLLQGALDRAAIDLADLGFQAPRVPLIDGHGNIWRPHTADPQAIRAYTLGPQIVEPYGFTAMLRTALREYAPDMIVLPGPGSSLGGAIGQVLVQEGWRGIRSKADFLAAQDSERPPLVSMAWPNQRAVVTP